MTQKNTNSQKQENHVMCLGSMGKDIFLPTDDGIVQEASQGIRTKKQWAFGYGAKIHIEDRFQALGGCACNVSVGLKRLTVPTSASGLIGDDTDGKWILGDLTREGVDVSEIREIAGGVTDSSMILVHTPTGERTIFVNRDVGENLIIDQSLFVDKSWVFIGSMYGDDVQKNMDMIHNAITTRQTKLLYNPGMRNIDKQPRKVCDLIHHTSILFVNKTEAKSIVQVLGKGYNETDLEDEHVLLEALLEQAKTGSIIVLTAGANGAWAKSATEQLHIAAKPQKIVDTTGAGDAFASGFTAAYLLKHSLSDCLKWGGANSHNVIGYYGGHEGLLTESQIADFAEQFEVVEC